jgi:hypothetical protein
MAGPLTEAAIWLAERAIKEYILAGFSMNAALKHFRLSVAPIRTATFQALFREAKTASLLRPIWAALQPEKVLTFTEHATTHRLIHSRFQYLVHLAQVDEFGNVLAEDTIGVYQDKRLSKSDVIAEARKIVAEHLSRYRGRGFTEEGEIRVEFLGAFIQSPTARRLVRGE